jgi:hypothetical protein
MTDQKDNEKQKIEISQRDRAWINGAKEIAIDKLRILPKAHTTETFDYDRAWRNYVYTTLSGKVDTDTIIHVTETEKEPWTEKLKDIQERYREGKENGWVR